MSSLFLGSPNFDGFVKALHEDERIHLDRKAEVVPLADGEAPRMAKGPDERVTMTEATHNALSAGFTLTQIFTAFMAGYLTGGFAGGVKAILALIVPAILPQAPVPNNPEGAA
jgi:hypothetical protein